MGSGFAFPCAAKVARRFNDSFNKRLNESYNMKLNHFSTEI